MLNYIKNFLGYEEQHELHVKIKTSQCTSLWNLYDYANNYMEKNKHSIKQNYLIYANQKSGKAYLEKVEQINNQKQNINGNLMGMIEPKIQLSGQRTFMFYPAHVKKPVTLYQLLRVGYKYQHSDLLSNEKIANSYLVLQKQKANSTFYQLKEHDIIKLGTKKLKIVNIQSELFSEKSTSTNFNMKSQQLTLTTNEQKQGVCKICLAAQQQHNQLISPCACQGSCSTVHIQCLQKWVKSRGSVLKNKSVQSIYFQKLNCEICKKKLPQKICLRNRQVYLYQLDKPSQTYMTLQSIDYKQQQKKNIFVVSPKQNQQIIIGRNETSDIRIQDKSISKNHAIIIMKNRKFYIKDNGSKYGTLIQITQPIDLKQNSQIQTGKFLFEFKTN